MRKTRRLMMVAVLGLMSCGSDETSTTSSTDVTTAATTVPATSTTIAPTTAAPTTATPTTAAPTTAAPTTVGPGETTSTEAPCAFAGGFDPVVVDFPMKMSSLVGSDIRTGRHDCTERVVIEFAGTGELPGYRVQYVPDDEVTDSPRGELVEVAGAATLVISAAAWMPDMEGVGYSGPREFVPTNVEAIEQLVQLENFEGMFQWAIGLDRERPFAVTTLQDPIRLVLDIGTGTLAGTG